MMTVSSLNTKIKSLLEATFMHIMVEGEIAQVTYAGSGHLYFTLKDDKSTLKCVMWKSSVAKLKFDLCKGEHIVVEGSVGVYTPRGEYQLIATHIEPYGKGALAVAFEQLKAKLEAKGYFDAAHKQLLPRYPKKIAIVTAAGSAALQDMLKVATKRWAAVEIVVVDVLVQGERAAEQISNAIRYADGLGSDIIIVGRGGGSSEDLWAFNEACVADAIYEAKTPTVSAVGHEVDILISDFVADLRAPTPSAAMEMVLADGNEMRYLLSERQEQFNHRVAHLLSQKFQQAEDLHGEISRFALGARLDALDGEFTRLAIDFAQTLRYRFSQYDALLDPVVATLTDTTRFVLRRKAAALEGLMSHLTLSDPHQQSRDAWAQINREGKKISLEEIEVGEVFDLVNDVLKMKVKAVEKEIFLQK